jgi:hypothetical protein
MDQVASLLKRPKLYYNIDGVGELGMGVMMLGFGLMMWVQPHAPKGSAWLRNAGVLCLAALLYYGTKAIKERVTYPRTGFVEYRKRDGVRSAIAAALLVPLFAVGIRVVHGHHWYMPPFGSLYGLFLSAGYAYGIARVARWKLIVAVAMAAGSLALAYPPASLTGAVADIGTYALCFLLFGPLFLISGAISFWLYLRRTPAPGVEER